jgi:hypothetical protein
MLLGTKLLLHVKVAQRQSRDDGRGELLPRDGRPVHRRPDDRASHHPVGREPHHQGHRQHQRQGQQHARHQRQPGEHGAAAAQSPGGQQCDPLDEQRQ